MQKLVIGDIIQDKHNILIIMALYLSGRKSKTEIYRAVSTNPRMAQKLQNLVDKGIITMKLERSVRDRNMVDLTPLGETYARWLCQLETSMGGDLEKIRASVMPNRPIYDEEVLEP